MVMQPQPFGGKGARWHYVPGGADLLPADVSPFYRGYHLQLTCSLLNGDGPDSDGTWAKDGKRRRERPKESLKITSVLASRAGETRRQEVE